MVVVQISYSFNEVCFNPVAIISRRKKTEFSSYWGFFLKWSCVSTSQRNERIEKEHITIFFICVQYVVF